MPALLLLPPPARAPPPLGLRGCCPPNWARNIRPDRGNEGARGELAGKVGWRRRRREGG